MAVYQSLRSQIRPNHKGSCRGVNTELSRLTNNEKPGSEMAGGMIELLVCVAVLAAWCGYLWATEGEF